MTAAEARAITAANQPKPPQIDHFLREIHKRIAEAAQRGEWSLPDLLITFEGMRMPGPNVEEWLAINSALTKEGFELRSVIPVSGTKRLEVSWVNAK